MSDFYIDASNALHKAMDAVLNDDAGKLRVDLDRLTKNLNNLIFANSHKRYGVAFVPDKKHKDHKDYDCYRMVIVEEPERRKVVFTMAGILIPANWRYPCGLFYNDGGASPVHNHEALEQFFIGAYLTLSESPVVQLIVNAPPPKKLDDENIGIGKRGM